MIKIINPELAELDKKVGNFYIISVGYFSSPVNSHGRKVYKDELEKLLKKSCEIKSESKFDELVIRNIQSNLTLNDMVIDYFNDPGFQIGVKEFFDKLAGEGTFDHLEQKVKSISWERIWENSKKKHERDYLRVNPFIIEAQKSARKWLPRIKKDILEYGIAKGYLPENFDMTLLLLPPKEGSENSSWDPATRIFYLGSYGFEFFLENKKIIAVPARAYALAFHEVLGHGVHQIHSEQMPASLKLTEEIGAITPTKSVTEGIAKNAEKEACNFLRQKLELEIKDEDIALLEERMDLDEELRMCYMYYALTKDREAREKGFNGYEHILQLTQNPILAKEFRNNFKLNFRDIWLDIGHTLGQLHYKRMLDQSRQELKGDYLGTNDFHKATLTGVWSSEVYPDAVAYIAKEKLKSNA